MIDNLLDYLKELFTGKRNVSLKDIMKLEELFKTIDGWLKKILPIGPDVIPIMTYSEAVKYFVNEKPSSPNFRKGAMLIQRHTDKLIFIQVFLDEKDQLITKADGSPYGRRVFVKDFDMELQDVFGNQELVIVE